MKRHYNWNSDLDSDDEYESLETRVKRAFQNVDKKYGKGVTTRRQAQKLLETPRIETTATEDESLALPENMDFDDEETVPGVKPSTSKALASVEEQNSNANKGKDETTAAYMNPLPNEKPPAIEPAIFQQDAVVAENNVVSAHIYKAFHQHQKVFR